MWRKAVSPLQTRLIAGVSVRPTLGSVLLPASTLVPGSIVTPQISLAPTQAIAAQSVDPLRSNLILNVRSPLLFIAAAQARPLQGDLTDEEFWRVLNDGWSPDAVAQMYSNYLSDPDSFSHLDFNTMATELEVPLLDRQHIQSETLLDLTEKPLRVERPLFLPVDFSVDLPVTQTENLEAGEALDTQHSQQFYTFSVCNDDLADTDFLEGVVVATALSVMMGTGFWLVKSKGVLETYF